jgi:predicted methyltransferase
MKEKIIKFIKDVLESRGIVQEIKTVEFDLDEVLEYLKESGVSN